MTINESRLLGPGDDALGLAAGHLFDSAAKPDAVARFLGDPNHHLLLAIAGGKPVGFVSGVELTHPDKGTEMFLYELAVDEGHRRLGVASELVAALRDLARYRLVLVVLPLATAQRDRDLGAIAREVHAQRDERVSLLPHLADEARDLLAVQQQLARAHRLVVHEVALGVRRDVHVLQPRLVPVDAHEAVAQVAPARADRLHLRAGRHHARLVRLIPGVTLKPAA